MKNINVPADYYKHKFKMLCEYNIVKGLKKDEQEDDIHKLLKELEQDEETVQDEINDGDVIEEPEIKEEIPTEFTDDSVKELETEKLAELPEIERVKQIQDLQSEKIEQMLSSLEDLYNTVNDLTIVTSDIEPIKQNLETVKAQVKEITPATPEESLKKMAAISGGITVEDYWAQYLNQNKPLEQIVTDTEETEIGLEPKKYAIAIDEISEVDNLDDLGKYY